MEGLTRREIGSEFWSVPVTKSDNRLFPEHTQFFLSGRSALNAILKHKGFRTAALPSWCCDSMIKPFLDAGIQITFYPVIGTRQNITNMQCDVMLVMDYFGFSGYSTVPDGYTGVVIRDVTHSLFSGKYDDADYYFGSLRKWCGVYSGGFAWSNKGVIERPQGNNEEVIRLRKEAMMQKAAYIQGKTSQKDYLRLFTCAEEQLDEIAGIFQAADEDMDRIRHMDVEYVRQKRRENASVLMEGLTPYCLFQELKSNDCPLFVPIVVEQRDALRKWLISHDIYCPVHWPLSNMHTLNQNEKDIYLSEISLVCDQRYDTEDMMRIVEVVKEGLEYVKGIQN